MRLPCLLLGAAVLTALVSTGCADKTAAAHTYQLGEKVTVGPLLYTVFETQWLTHTGTPPDEKVPQNRFFLVRVSIVNSTGGEVLAPTLSVEDDKGTTYPEVTSEIGAPQWIGLIRRIQPADSVAGNLVFDCPAGHYKLHVTDPDGTKEALVDIPLTFTSETPDVPQPAESKRDPNFVKK